jgi:hypothetical protein
VLGLLILQIYAAVKHLRGVAWDLPNKNTAVKHGLGVQKDGEWVLVR